MCRFCIRSKLRRLCLISAMTASLLAANAASGPAAEGILLSLEAARNTGDSFEATATTCADTSGTNRHGTLCEPTVW